MTRALAWARAHPAAALTDLLDLAATLAVCGALAVFLGILGGGL